MHTELIKLCVDTCKGNVMNYSKDQANEVIRKAFVDILGTDKPSAKVFRKHKLEIFEIIEEVVDQTISSGMAKSNFFDQFVEYRDLNLGDTNVFYVPNASLLQVSKFSGNHWDLKRQRVDEGQEFAVSTDTYGIKVYEYFTRFLAGRIDFVALVAKIQESVDEFIAGLTYTAFMNATNALPSTFKVGGSFDADDVLTMTEHVQASNAGSEIVLVGTRSGLKKLVGNIDGMLSDSEKEQRNKLGYVGYWEGHRLMVLPQVHKANGFEFAFDNNKVLALPTGVKPIKVVREGEALVNEISNGTTNMDMSMEYAVQFKLGIAILFNVMYGVVELA